MIPQEKLLPVTLKNCVTGNVIFDYYQGGLLHYTCEYTGFKFTVPVEDTGNGKFTGVDKAMLFMRWIRKALQESSVACNYTATLTRFDSEQSYHILLPGSAGKTFP